jgi:hypothetical protein
MNANPLLAAAKRVNWDAGGAVRLLLSECWLTDEEREEAQAALQHIERLGTLLVERDQTWFADEPPAVTP